MLILLLFCSSFLQLSDATRLLKEIKSGRIAKVFPLEGSPELQKLKDLINEAVVNSEIDARDYSVHGKERTALHYAAMLLYGGSESLICKLLLEGGADINARTIDGFTPLMEAAHRSHGGVVQFLLQNGANAFLEDEHGKTALNHAARENSKHVLKDHMNKIILESKTDEKKYGRYNTDAEFPRQQLIMHDERHPPKWGKRDLRWNYLMGLNPNVNQKVLYPLGPILDPDIMLLEIEENLILHVSAVDFRQKLSPSERKKQENILEAVQTQLISKKYCTLLYHLNYDSDYLSIRGWKRNFYGALVKALALRVTDDWKRLGNLKERKDEACPICMDKREKMMVRECDHMFCEMCDKNLLGKKCPLCRKKTTIHSMDYQTLVNKIEKLYE